jgi:hypothetical protein
MIANIMLAARGFYLEDFVNLPKYGGPMRFQVLAIVLGQPDLAAILNELVFSGLFLWIGVLCISAFIFLTPKDGTNKLYYMRRLLFLSMILLFWVHLMGPRGVYKYYFVIFAPFFSILSSSRMVTSKEETVPFSVSMLVVPFLLSLMIAVPNRNVYFFGLIIMMIAFLIASQIGVLWKYVKLPFNAVGSTLRNKFDSLNIDLSDNGKIFTSFAGLFAFLIWLCTILPLEIYLSTLMIEVFLGMLVLSLILIVIDRLSPPKVSILD